MKRALACLAAITAALTPVVPLPRADAAAATLPDSSIEKTIPIESFADIAVDHTTNQAVITERDDTKSPLVITLTGQVVGRLTGLASAWGMALSSDGQSVWIAVRDQARIVQVDLASLATVHEIALDPATCAFAVAEAAGKVLIADPCGPSRQDLLIHDLASSQTTRFAEELEVNAFAVSPTEPTIVAIGADHDQLLLDVSGATPTIEARIETTGASRVAFSADGSIVYFHPRDIEARSRADLSLLETYETSTFGAGLAVSPINSHLAYIAEFDSQARIALGGDPANTTDRHAPRGFHDFSLSWSADEKWLFGVTENTNTDKFKWNALPALGWPRCNGLEPTYLGSEGDDVITGVSGVILARGGNDTVTVNRGENTICGGDGDDTLQGWILDDWIHAGTGNDIVIGNEGNDRLIGGAGTDELAFVGEKHVTVDLAQGISTASHDTDTISGFENATGTSGHDSLYGNDAANVLNGGTGRDVLDGRGGPDLLIGDKGNDVIAGGGGNDTLSGGNGRDLLAGEKGNDAIDGGGGVDTISYVGSAKGVDVSLAAGTASGQGADTIANVEWLLGSSKPDRLEGNNGANYIEGRLGGDTLIGKGGADFLAAGKGTDSADGGGGIDSCIGAEATTSCEQSFDLGLDLGFAYHPDAGRMRPAALFPGFL